MASTYKKKVNNRKDSHGQVLRVGEYERPNGRYEFKYKGHDYKMHSIYAGSLPELRRAENEIRVLIDRGYDPARAQTITLNEMFDIYINAKHGIADQTRVNYEYYYNHFVRDSFGKRRIAKINFMHVQEFLFSLLEKDMLNANTLEGVGTQIGAALNYAVKLRYIPTNPAKDCMREIKKSKLWDGNERKRDALTHDQQRRFSQYYMNHEVLGGWKNVITFLLGTGCRIGETLGLTWDDIDFEEREIHIRRALLYRPDRKGKCRMFISSPKTSAGVRTIPMLEEVYDALVDERLLQLQFCDGETGTVDGVTNFVFTQVNGEPYKPQEINKGIARLIKAYNEEEDVKAAKERREPVLLPHFSAHHLRHTYCTRLCETDLPLKQIQDYMGHCDLRTTSNIYAEVNPEARRKSLTKMEGRIIL